MRLFFSLLIFSCFIPFAAVAGSPAGPQGIQCIVWTDVLVEPENCDQRNGSITLVHDGTAPFTYAWTHDPGLNDSTVSGLGAGVYAVTVTDAAGCSADTTILLQETDSPVAFVSSLTAPSCSGLSDGGANLTVDSSNYTITWNTIPPQTGVQLSGVPAGTYEATVENSVGCQARVTVNIPEPAGLVFAAEVTPASCGAPVGIIVVSPQPGNGGIAPYTYAWSSNTGGASGPSASNLPAGSYTLTINDVNGCQTSLLIDVPSDNDSFGADLQVDDATCFGDSTGSASAVPTGGTGSYTYEWVTLPGEQVIGNAASISNVPAGTYGIVITDAQGADCTFEGQVTIGQPDPVSPNFQTLEASGCRDADGQVSVEPSGGTAPYSVLWSTGDTSLVVDSLRAEVYEVTVTDTLGCATTQSVVVSNTAGPFFEVEILRTDVCGLGEGIARLNITEGTAPYRINWWTNRSQPSDTSLYAYNLFTAEGNNLYSVVLQGADSCLGYKVFSMPGNDPMEITNAETTIEYCDLSNGTATVAVRGGTAPYRYTWSSSPPQRQPTATGLITGPYEVIVRDTNNCEVGTIMEVGFEAGFSLGVSTTGETCFDVRDGTATAITAGGEPPFSFEWNSTPPQLAETALDLPGGAYQVRVTDSEGCIRTGYGVVEDGPRVIADFVASPDTMETMLLSEATVAFRHRAEDGAIFRWDFGDGDTSRAPNPIHAYEDTGSYVVELLVTDESGLCRDSIRRGPFVVSPEAFVFIPNAFTPNQDISNDEFYIDGAFLEDLDLRIFSRWGQEVFYGQSKEDRWDGTLPDGRPAPEGVYFYALEVRGPEGQLIKRKGSITLYR